MNQNWTFVSPIAAILLMLANQSVAQDMQRVTFPTSRENAKYTQQYIVDVGDVPGHQVRVFEVQRTFPNDPPIIGGLALKEYWGRGVSDYTNNTGSGNIYGMYVLENGDKFFTHSSMVAHKAGSGLSAITAGRIIGGTGRFESMRGAVRRILTADPEAGINDGVTIIDYTLNPRTEAPAQPPIGQPGQR